MKDNLTLHYCMDESDAPYEAHEVQPARTDDDIDFENRIIDMLETENS